MFKIDWCTAIGGAVVGYLVKGKVESTKAKFSGIYTGAINTLKESFSEDSKPTQPTQAGKAGQNNTNG